MFSPARWMRRTSRSVSSPTNAVSLSSEILTTVWTIRVSVSPLAWIISVFFGQGVSQKFKKVLFVVLV